MDGIRFAGEEGFIDLEVVSFGDDAVHHDLLAGGDHDNIAQHHLLAGDLAHLAVAAHPRMRLTDNGQGIEGVLGAQLLNNPDNRVRDNEQAEGAIDPRSSEDHGNEQHTEHEINAGENVIAHNLRGRAPRAVGEGIRFAVRGELGGLCGAQPAGRVAGGYVLVAGGGVGGGVGQGEGLGFPLRARGGRVTGSERVKVPLRGCGVVHKN